MDRFALDFAGFPKEGREGILSRRSGLVDEIDRFTGDDRLSLPVDDNEDNPFPRLCARLRAIHHRD